MGNGWRKITLPYTVTAATVLAFDFVGNVESEIHANGLENDMDETIIKPQQSGTLSQWQLRAVFVVLVLLAGVVTWMIWSQFGTQLAAVGGAKSVAEMEGSQAYCKGSYTNLTGSPNLNVANAIDNIFSMFRN